MHKLNSCLISDASSERWFFFDDAIEIYQTNSIEEIIPILEKIEKLVSSKKLYAAGFISFEAAPAFDSSLPAKIPEDFPLLWFGVYNKPSVFEAACTLPHLIQGEAFSSTPLEKKNPNLYWQTSVSEAEYNAALKKIKKYIQLGDTYQVNYTFRFRSDAPTESKELFSLVQLMRDSQRGKYQAWVQTEDWTIYSASPELFFHKDGERLISKPMKGTAPRGEWFEKDLSMAQDLQNSEKQRAENVMIVDMVRHDMGKIAQTGSVEVTSLFEVEKYPRQWQMTSQIECLTHASITDIFRAMFPAASITGTPKKRAMEIIQELEHEPRKIYTGSIGFITPGRQAQFNVAIRTLLIDKKKSLAEYGSGSGVVWDSRTQEEFKECLNKAAILTSKPAPFSLVETILWEPESGFFLLEGHLERLKNSASYFSFEVDIQEIRLKLNEIACSLDEVYRIRLLVGSKGEITIQKQPLSLSRQVVSVRLAGAAVDPSDPLLYHKTTRREIYEGALSESSLHKACDDVILWNPDHEITESTIANIVVKMQGQLYTPPLACGLLPGVYRSYLLQKGGLKERIIKKDQLNECSDIYLINSVRKKWKIRLI